HRTLHRRSRRLHAGRESAGANCAASSRPRSRLVTRMSDSRAAAPPLTGSEIRPVAHPFVDRLASGVVTAVPPLLFGVAVWFGWGGALHWQDLVVLLVTYQVVGIGVTVGFQRLLTHRSFKTNRGLRAAFGALGSA